MLSFFYKIADVKRVFITILLVLIMTITFETAQQLYYIKRFSLGSDDVTFFNLLKTQTYRWLIWMSLSLILIWFVKTKSTNKKLTLTAFIKYSFVILGLVFINILFISAIQMFLTEDNASLSLLVNEYISFFIFQKAPMYTLGYIALAMTLHLFFVNEQLKIDVQTLFDLKQENVELYKKLSPDIEDKASILNIKIGNKRKIIPVKDIYWIEADDYCVKVHTTSAHTYTMRSSLKALEQKLEDNFLRVHRKAIVNMDLAKEVNLSQSPVLILQNDEEIAISKSNLKTVRDFTS